jgi:3-oxoacyl-[acyl-carrier-protein] synthase II
VVTLEALEVATARGARILAELEGEGMTFSAGAGGEPGFDAVQIGAAIQRALVTSGRIQSEVDLLALHAAGTPEGDRQEATGVKRIFGAATRHHMYTPALKSHYGHMLGASGPMALAIVLEAMHRQVIPWTRNLDEEDPQIDLDANPSGPRADTLRVAMVNATGWAHNATIAICHPDAMRAVEEPAGDADVLPIPDRGELP